MVYLKSNGDPDHIDRVLLSGGGALIVGLGPALAERLRVPVDVVDPLRKVQHAATVGGDPEELGPQLTVGVGLALRKAR